MKTGKNLRKYQKYLITSLVISFFSVISFFILGPKLIDKTTITYTDVNTSTPVNFKVAFIGDQGYGKNSTAVLRMIKNEGANMVIHSGDFEYLGDPDAWDNQISNVLGSDFPYFASIGNHELNAWAGYQEKLKSRLKRIDGAICMGNLGVASACTYKGLFFILSGIGTKGYFYDTSKLPFYAPWHFPYTFLATPSQFLHTAYIKNQLAHDNSTWKICSWHKIQKLMQTGYKVNEVGWGPYEECRKAGAIIATAHQHSYSRTHLMNSFKDQKIASMSDNMQIEKGKTFAFVSGLAGNSIHPQDDELALKEWWAAVYTATQDANYGALFCTFNVNGIENKAYCYFKDIDGRIIDKFDVVSNVE